jgi:hypothetical protein
MRRTPVVLGILSMVFGGLIALYQAFVLASQSLMKNFADLGKMGAGMPHRPGQPDFGAAMEAGMKVAEQLRPYTYAIAGGMLIMSLALIVVGFGLYKRQAWSRPASLLWGGAALLFIPFQIFIQTQIIQPRMHEAMSKMLEGQPGGAMMDSMMGVSSGLVIITQIVFYAPFPVILLFLMGRSSAKNDLLSA